MIPAAEVASILRALRCDLSDEKRTQAEIGMALSSAGISHEREVILSPGERIDFLAEGGIGIEVKLKRNRRVAVAMQLARYAAIEQIAALILVTNLSMGLPASIGGKPAYYVSLGRAWL